MPSRDPRLCPALIRALPADDEGATDHQDGFWPRMVLFGDGEWRLVQAEACWRDRHGRLVVQVTWHIFGETWSESYLHDPRKIAAAG